jgi:hypothetical protein
VDPAHWSAKSRHGATCPRAMASLPRGKYYEELCVDHYLQRVSEELMPLLDRADRLLIRNTKMVQDLRRGPMTTLAINQASQVNVGTQQLCIVEDQECS